MVEETREMEVKFMFERVTRVSRHNALGADSCLRSKAPATASHRRIEATVLLTDKHCSNRVSDPTRVRISTAQECPVT